MNLKFSKKAKAALSGFLAASMIIPFGITIAADEEPFDGDFDTGAFSEWDGLTYDFSWYNPANETYVINSAAQLAALAILSNDFSSDEYADFKDALPDNIPSQYIDTVDSFENKVIELNTDIDLRGNAWLPIAYAWNTPNVTKSDYDALGHVPSDLTAVDSWVGDENGNMINTRYLEYPESEMRYRDLLYAVTATDGYAVTDGGTLTRKLSDGDVTAKKIFIPSTSDIDPYRAVVPVAAYRNNPSLTPSAIYNSLPQKEMCGALGYMYIYTTDTVVDQGPSGIDIKGSYIDRAFGSLEDKIAYKSMELHDTDIYESYVYADIAPYADIDGFCGTFDGCGYRIKGLHPETPWTDDMTKRISTFDPIGKGLFGYIGTTGSVTNLNIQGEYLNTDVVSYSAFLCAYNYGTIENCYIDGTMEQGLVTQYYPIRRDYGPNGTSVYEFSNVPGTVLPVGNSGFVTAMNNGTISDCTTTGAVTQAYRQFGFITCTNNGTISGCKNKASFSTYEVETDFITDEWSYSYNMTDNFDFTNQAYYDAYARLKVPTAGMNAFNNIYADRTTQSDCTIYDWYIMGKNPYYADYLKYITAYMQGSASDGAPWVPGMYMPEDGESVAANHLYGVYGYTAVGGICAVNNGIITGCENSGNIQIMYNTSTRNQGTQYAQGEGASEKDYLSYIRPGNAYGLFSTQTETINLAAGIAPINKRTIELSYNSGRISKRALTARDKIFVEGGTFGLIAYTENGFYANDSIIYTTDTGTPTYNPLGLLWWFDEDDTGFQYTRGERSFDGSGTSGWTGANGNQVPADPNVGKTYTTLPYLGTSPYPLYQKAFVDNPYTDAVYTNSTSIYSETVTYQLTAGICVDNIGNITDTINDGAAYAGITYISDGLDDAVLLSNNEQNGPVDYNIGYYLRNTFLSGNTVTNKTGKYGIAYIASNENVNIAQIDTDVYEGASGYCLLYGDENMRMTISDVILYDAELDGLGISKTAYNIDFNGTYNFQPSINGVSEIKNCNILNAYMYAPAVNAGIGHGTVNAELTNLNFYGASAKYALGDFKNGTYTDLHVNTLKDDNTFGMCEHILYAKNAAIEGMTAFTDTNDRILDINACIVNDIIVYGDTPEITNELGYRYFFADSNCKDMILQTNINIEWKNPNSTKATQNIPGVLKGVTDTNTFVDCVIQTPNGALSYPTFNYQLDDDRTIMSDAILAYDPDARKSGALAYYMDNGDSDERTFDYTVAFDDSEDILSEITDAVDIDRVFDNSVRELPAYTRKKISSNERSYYRLSIPFTSNGAGEIIGQLSRNSDTFATLATDQVFPVTDLFAYPGEKITLRVETRPGYDIVSCTQVTKSGETDLSKALFGKGTALGSKKDKTTTITMGTEDILILSEWSNVYQINIEENPNVSITTNTSGSAEGQRIYVDTILANDSYEIESVWYYKYKRDDSNRSVLDTSTKYEIDLHEMYFDMPAADVRIYASLLGTNAKVQRVVLNGTEAIIDNDAHTITVVMENSSDLTNTFPEVFDTIGTTSVSPAPTERQDFTKPVIYSLTAENGAVVNYTMTVMATEDGTISYFEILGKAAEINADTHTIDIQLSSDIDLTNVTPKIVWSGSSISPEGAVDLSSGSIVYHVTSSLGVVTDYTVNVTIPASSEALQEFNISIPGITDSVWTIDNTRQIITTTVPYGTDISSCTIERIKWYGMSVNMLEGDEINLTRCNYLTIKADNGDTITYAIVVAEAPFDAKTINQFTLYGHDGLIDETNKTITVTVPAKYDITDIAPDILAFTAKSVTDPYAAHNFTSAITYEVTAYDGTCVTYTVTVIRG